ncbi:hypothetical protein CO608_03330 [Lysobacteraceae bacterium NML08-0793]|nr:hypothetical protein CO608_03330 [Xanthomonadaceae bacterium NML08-0793]
MNSIYQSEAAECGLASLAMVAGHHGLELSLPELRQRFPLSLKGAKLAQLIHIAQALGFKTRALCLDMGDLDKLALPCVLHWDLNHFVVLQKVSGRKLVILDPAIGKRVLTLEEAGHYQPSGYPQRAMGKCGGQAARHHPRNCGAPPGNHRQR